MNGNTTAPSSPIDTNRKYIPPTPWVKLSADEKIERIREQVKILSSSIYQTQNLTRRLREILSNHSHNDGKVVEQVKSYEGGGEIGALGNNSLNSEEVYF